jgi:FkbM family methyltransferase
MFDFLSRRLKWELIRRAPPLEWTVALPFGGKVRCNFVKQRIYPGRVSRRRTALEWYILRYYSHYVRPDFVFLDVGANVGLHTAAMGSQLTTGRIYAFEPEEALFPLLRKTIEINGLTRVAELVPVAVADRTGTAKFSRDFYSTATGCLTEVSGNSLAHEWCRLPPATVDVSTITLDEFCRSRHIVPDLVKIDVEGAEHLVLAGMKRILSEDRPAIVMDGYTMRAITELQEAGYQLYSLDSEDGVPREIGDELPFAVLARRTATVRRPVAAALK